MGVTGLAERGDGDRRPWEVAWESPLVRLALAWMAGTALGWWLPILWMWWGVGLLATGASLVMAMRRRERGARCWGLVAVVGLAAGWCVSHTAYAPSDTVARFVAEESQLAQVTGRVVTEPKLTTPNKGPFGAFSYRQPGTYFELDVSSIVIGGSVEPASGVLLVKIDQADHRITKGQTIRATGWLAAIPGPMNPGEFDYAGHLKQRGVVGRLSLKVRGNWEPIAASTDDHGVWLSKLVGLRDDLRARALASLRLGMEDHPRSLALLQTLLLGRWESVDPEMTESFRRVGLAHVLSISGAHLGILLGIVWLVARGLVPHPARVAIILLVVLAFYLLAVPARVPIVRAAIMAGALCIGFASGRRVAAIEMLGVAAIIVLFWRPVDLLTPGFQLSFTAVAALLLFVPGVSEWLWPRSPFESRLASPGRVAARWVVDYVAVSIVAFLAVSPLVAYHFEMISPLAVLLSVLALPVLAAVLAVGFAKILIWLALPSGSLLLAGPLAWLAEVMLTLVEHTENWPGAAILLTRPPGVAWVVAAMAVAAAWMASGFARRRKIGLATIGLVILWAAVADQPRLTGALRGGGLSRPPLVINMLMVGDGSCFIIRFDDGQTLMFDCGSQAYLDMGQRTVVPALRRLGIDRIDTLMLSHADIDHYVGTLDVVDRVAVGRVLMPPMMLTEAAEHPRGAAAFLIERLLEQGLEPRPVTMGWTDRVGHAQLELLWPPVDLVAKRANDTSLVLSIRVAGHRVLLNGDIQQQAITRLLDSPTTLDADVTDLPHHGSFVEASPAWLDAVDPAVVLQSSGPARLRNDKWADTLRGQPIDRYITAEQGMVEVRIDHDGSITVETFR